MKSESKYFSWQIHEKGLRVLTEREGIFLKEGQYLLKVSGYNNRNLGYMCRPTKKGLLPVTFNNWREGATVYVLDEFLREGWSVTDFRKGMSTGWVTLTHPLGFDLEIRSDKFIEIIITQGFYLENGIIKNKCKFVAGKSNDLVVLPI